MMVFSLIGALAVVFMLAYGIFNIKTKNTAGVFGAVFGILFALAGIVITNLIG